MNKHLKPEALEQYAFFWSEARLLVAALALFIGGYPPILFFNPFGGLNGVMIVLLNLSWSISGASAVYLLYRWYQNNQHIFGGKNRNDLIAFFVMIVSGINLGFSGIGGSNIGMWLFGNKITFMIAGVIYIIAAGYLYKRYTEHHNKLF